MELAQKLQALRKEHGFSQEGLADQLGVSRQAVSKWESGQSQPDLNNLIALSELYGVTTDSMVKEEKRLTPQQAWKAEESEGLYRKEADDREGADTHPFQEAYRKGLRFEYKSKVKLFGLPLVHLNFGFGLPRVAKGVIAVGDLAVGIVALGGLSAGLISVGGISAAALLSLGGISLGGIALGGLAVGIVSIGGGAIATHLAIGGGALSHHIAIGAGGLAPVVINKVSNGIFQIVRNGELLSCTAQQALTIIQQELTGLAAPIAAFLELFIH